MMPLLPATLASGLESMEPTDDEATAIDNFVTAWEDYFKDASVAGTSTTPGALTGAILTMRGALTGMSNQDAAPSIIQAAITSFWGTVVSSVATIWVVTPPLITVTPPPTLGAIGAALIGAFSANTSGTLDLAASANVVANAIHPTQLGAVTSQGPPPTPGTVL